MGRLWAICLLLSIHPQRVAGELINVTKQGSLKPVISIKLNDTESLQQNTQQKAQKILTLHLVANNQVANTPVAGKYTLQNNLLSFQPYYTLGYATTYEVQYKEDGVLIDKKRFTTPVHKHSGNAAHVITAYPMADTIPYNTLFFHVRFNMPMQQDKHAYKHIAVYDEQGEERTLAWRQRSFWLDSGRLLVLMIHPGRVKNGIHYESPLFDSGKTYTLKVDTAIKDINGQPVSETYTQRFYISGEDRTIPQPQLDNIAVPNAATTAPIILTFSEGMDYASVLEGVKLFTKQGDLIPCSITRQNSDDTYSITPHQPWKKRKYTLTINGAVYDYAANRINRPFEITDINDIKKDKKEKKWSFKVK